jgi:uncharacterized metal-binding protein
MGNNAGGTRLIYTCSGAADVGAVADRTGRSLVQSGFGKMSCIAAIGAGLEAYVNTAKASEAIVVIDGCPLACARKNLERIGAAFEAFVLTEMGLEKGKTPVNDTVTETMAKQIMQRTTAGNTREADTENCGCA